MVHACISIMSVFVWNLSKETRQTVMPLLVSTNRPPQTNRGLEPLSPAVALRRRC